ncbi:MAG: translation initiation factor IF-2 [Candidatus Faecousia sp.]|nr:translation initiation factor IF-2 [Clostridiales bacterium]MDD5883920.1 translation initiation factor IF-2 [Bacillota bacterium]MDY4598511.1 translation initiation factor IF-2 [Candidatus Faecousia sp.]
MSFVKYRVKEVAADFGVAPKEISEIVGKFGEKPKSYTQVMTDEELNVVFDYMTQTHQISSMEQIFAVKPTAPKAEPKAENKPEPHKDAKPAAQQSKTQNNARPQNAPKPQSAPAAQQQAAPKADKPKEPERKRERRVVDTSAVQVNANRFADVDNLVSERVQNYQGGKQRIGGGKGKQPNKQQKGNFRGNKSRNEEQEKMRRLQMEVARKAPVTVKIPDEITVGELASRMKKTAGEVIKCLMKNGVMAGINQTIDFDTAEFVATEMGCKVEKEVTVTIEEKIIDDHVDTAEELETRAPVVVVMGHVDHGKTSTLDAIRKTSVTAGEAGGITQHIGAYTVDVNGKMITFLDTPGHAAFTSMRARGAKSTDIAVLVVAADDGIMPQTVESINHAKAAQVPIIVAINKMDKPTANPDKIKEQLTKYDLVPEEWGGDTIIVPISAKTGQGLDELLEMILLTAEVQELKANPNRRAKGVVIEARLDKARGPVATLLVQNGTLKQGDIVIAGTAVGRVRVMTNDKGRTVKTAGPSVPVEITGLADVPTPGDEFNAVIDERMARELVEQRRQAQKDAAAKLMQKVTLDNLFAKMQEGEMKELPLIVKADVQGSAEAVKASLEKLSNEEVRVRVIHAGVGAINESDILLASTSGAIIVGFNVRPDAAAQASGHRANVDMRFYRVIYDAVDEIEAAMKGMLAPKYEEVVIGHAEVRMTYKVSAIGTVAGCMVKDGKVTRDAQVRVLRDNIVVHEGEVGSLQRFKDAAKEVSAGFECGMTVAKYNDIREGDIFECFTMQEVKR